MYCKFVCGVCVCVCVHVCAYLYYICCILLVAYSPLPMCVTVHAVTVEIITPRDPAQRGCQLSLRFSHPVKEVHQTINKLGVVVSVSLQVEPYHPQSSIVIIIIIIIRYYIALAGFPQNSTAQSKCTYIDNLSDKIKLNNEDKRQGRDKGK